VRPVTPPILAEIPQTDLDPAGFVYADTRSVTDDQGAATDPSNRGQPLGTTVDTSRTLYVGDRVVLRCWGNDSHGRGGSAGGCIPRAVAGNSRCVATGSNSPGSCSRGRSGIAPTAFGTRNPQEQTSGVGMAADSRYHRHRGPDEEGYDGWVVFYYRVQPIPPDAGTRGRRRANQLGRQCATSRAPSTSVG
jgi:hypothetical protein